MDIKKYDNSPSHYSCRDQLGMDMDKYNVVHTGSPYIGRGIEKFIELCKISNQIFFTHIGGTLDEITRLKSLAEKNRVSNCIFLSNLDEKEIIKYQKGANLLFYVITKKWPTYWCCSPLKIPEYMASGTPILASAVGSITEFLDDENSFLFYSDNNSLKKQLLEAKLNPKLSLHKASLARKKVEKFYTYDIRSESLIHYLNNL